MLLTVSSGLKSSGSMKLPTLPLTNSFTCEIPTKSKLSMLEGSEDLHWS